MTLSQLGSPVLRLQPRHGRRSTLGTRASSRFSLPKHSGLLSARSLVDNESFARVASFLTLVSMSFVGLALVAQARGFDRDFLVLAGIAMVFDLLVGLATIARVLSAVDEDLRALHGMSRLRHAYLESHRTCVRTSPPPSTTTWGAS